MPDPYTLLVFQLGGQACGLPIQDVHEIIPMASLSRPPGLPPLLEGFLDLAGTAVPVLALARLLRLPEQPPGLYTPLLVLTQYPLALLVESVSHTVSVSTDAFLPVRENHTFNDCAQAEIPVEGRVIHLLSTERLLLEKERQCLAELQVIAQERLRNIGERNA